MKIQLRTIDITAKEWFDKNNGNSYFSARIILDYGMETEREIRLPFQYGYGDHYLDMSARELGLAHPLSRTCRESGVILRALKTARCLKKEVIQWGKA